MDREKEISHRIKKWERDGKIFPYKVEIWNTSKCNLRCKFCENGINNKYKKSDLSDSELINFVNDCISMEVREFFFSGAEPTFRKKNLFEMMKIIKKNDKKGTLFTNGTLLNSRDVKDLIDIEWDDLIISLDGPDAETHDYLRGVPGAFDRTIDFINKVNHLKKKNNPESPHIIINFVITNVNYGKILDIIELCHSLNCNILFQSLMIDNEECEKLKLNSKQTNDFLQRVIDARMKVRDYGIFTNLDDFNDPKLIQDSNEIHKIITRKKENSKGFDNLPCFEPWTGIRLKAEGDVGPCPEIDLSDNCNIRKNKLEDIWFGPEFNSIREKVINNDISDICKTCCTSTIFENDAIRNHL